MALTFKNYNLSAYGRALINNWQPMKQWIMAKNLSALRELHNDTEAAPSDLITDDHLLEVLSGPYALFFQRTLSAYSIIHYAKHQHALHEEELFKDYDASKASPLSDTDIKQIASLDLKQMQKQLNDTLQQHDQQWETVTEQWQKAILNELNALKITEQEQEALMAYEPISEIINRFNDLNLTPPKHVLGKISFADCLNLKAYLLVYSCLSRQHLPNSPDDIQKTMKKTKKLLNEISSQTKELDNQQTNDINTIVAPLSFMTMPSLKKKKKKKN